MLDRVQCIGVSEQNFIDTWQVYQYFLAPIKTGLILLFMAGH
jgi:hypothetical protein